jgi:hypothetical protein
MGCLMLVHCPTFWRLGKITQKKFNVVWTLYQQKWIQVLMSFKWWKAYCYKVETLLMIVFIKSHNCLTFISLTRQWLKVLSVREKGIK